MLKLINKIVWMTKIIKKLYLNNWKMINRKKI